MTVITGKATKVASLRTRARAAEILGREVDDNGVTDILWMIAIAVGYAREHAESPQFGPDDVTTQSYRQLAKQLQRGL
jgi:TPP-dependent pyruvate/acetoin dehydrogenase alpha subunit